MHSLRVVAMHICPVVFSGRGVHWDEMQAGMACRVCAAVRVPALWFLPVCLYLADVVYS